LYKDLETDKPKKKPVNDRLSRGQTIGIISDMLEGYTTKQLQDMAVRNGVVRRQAVKRMRRREIIARLANNEYCKKRSKGHFGAPSR
jgi:hypothetical protein